MAKRLRLLQAGSNLLAMTVPRKRYIDQHLGLTPHACPRLDRLVRLTGRALEPLPHQTLGRRSIVNLGKVGRRLILNFIIISYDIDVCHFASSK